MSRTAGLKPFKKGADPRRNTKGRPVLPDISEALAKLLGGADEEASGLNRVLKALEAKALKGDTKAIEILLDRGYGKAKQSVDLTTDGEKLQQPIIQILPPSDEVKPEAK